MADSGFTRFELDGSVDHRGGQQFVNGKGFAGDGYESVHRIEPHGFASHPVAGGIGLLTGVRGNRDSAYVVGGENPSLRPQGDFLTAGGTAIYDAAGNIVSIVSAKIRIVHSAEIRLTAPQIILEGEVHIGGEGGVPASMQGTIDSDGDVDISGFATKVFLT
ncbi:phage baseplate assembly protein [Aurantimonas sp. 22II-16-19i]|uniref:phage baseplate assembly protein domain-containing protein n=1 Tax=Aurantimonas sp. 22II-16-19i TaxID=1317114 RepID=UPI0009F7B842|nr:phage baseplate assembly protein [Aurantimonas sp. 22II-16-19i]ORE91007.1 Mu-like prophage protein GP45-like protein [Aurantimonas sp. 22II-16-19i]